MLAVIHLFFVTAQQKRNPLFRPLQKTENGHPGLDFLQDAIIIFEKWQQSRNAGLTSETFMACIQTMRAVTEMVQYLQDKHGFIYVLSGKLMSDPIEGRFGWYRQSNGGNFYMSVADYFHSLLCVHICSDYLKCAITDFFMM